MRPTIINLAGVIISSMFQRLPSPANVKLIQNSSWPRHSRFFLFRSYLVGNSLPGDYQSIKWHLFKHPHERSHTLLSVTFVQNISCKNPFFSPTRCLFIKEIHISIWEFMKCIQVCKVDRVNWWILKIIT